MDVVQDVAQDEHAIGGAPEGDVARRMSRNFQDLETGHPVAFAKFAGDRAPRSREHSLRECREPRGRHLRVELARLRTAGIAGAAPERNLERIADGAA